MKTTHMNTVYKMFERSNRPIQTPSLIIQSLIASEDRDFSHSQKSKFEHKHRYNMDIPIDFIG